MRSVAVVLLTCLALSPTLGQEFASLPSPVPFGSQFASSQVVVQAPGGALSEGSFVPFGGQPFQPLQQQVLQESPALSSQPLPTEGGWQRLVPWRDQNELFHYTWIDFGGGQGLRIHQLEWTNAWADLRSPNFFLRQPEATAAFDFNVGLNFSVQWWKERPEPDERRYGTSFPPPTLYDLYVDIGWHAQIAPGWLLDLTFSPGLSTDFRVTPPDGFRMRGQAITVMDITSNLRGALGVWYLNRATTKLLPVAGLLWQAGATRIEAIFPRPRLVQDLGCWKGRSWEFSLGGEFGGGGWAFKNPEGTRETVDYRDLRVLAGLAWSGKHNTGYLEFGYVFSRELQYSTHHRLDFDPGNAFIARVGWTY